MKLLPETIDRDGVLVFTPETSSNAVVLRGVIRELDPAVWFLPLVERLHRTAVEARLPAVVLDLRELEYANAAAWKCVVYWIKLATVGDAGYRMHVLSDSTRRWQDIAVSTLRIFGGDRVSVRRT